MSATNTFPNAYPLVFVKPGFPPEFEIKSGNREFDIIFCGTTLVPTKNHHSFMALVSELDREGRKFNICVVGDEGSIPEFTEFTNSYFANIQISNMGVVSRKEIFSLFAKSKICLVCPEGTVIHGLFLSLEYMVAESLPLTQLVMVSKLYKNTLS